MGDGIGSNNGIGSNQEGELLMSSSGYIHYWFYISGMNDVAATLETVEGLLGELFVEEAQ